MSLSSQDVRHVARLARLALTDHEVESLRDQLSEILAYAEKVGEVATTDVPPTGHAFGLVNVYRDDIPHEPLAPAEALSTAPAVEEERFMVPRIVTDDPAAGAEAGDA